MTEDTEEIYFCACREPKNCFWHLLPDGDCNEDCFECEYGQYECAVCEEERLVKELKIYNSDGDMVIE